MCQNNHWHKTALLELGSSVSYGSRKGFYPMINHTWADNAMRCAGARIKELRPFEHQSWAYYRIDRERETLNALYDLYWVDHVCRELSEFA